MKNNRNRTLIRSLYGNDMTHNMVESARKAIRQGYRNVGVQILKVAVKTFARETGLKVRIK